MIEITVNGSSRELEGDTTVAALVELLGGRADGRGVAVAIEGEVVPRSAWPETALSEGVRVEILVAVQGG